jgi:methyl-accepting chemotaxis protein
MAGQRAAVPAYFSEPLQSFAEVGQPALDAAKATLGELDQLIQGLGLDTRIAAPVAEGLARYREQLGQYAGAAIAVELQQNDMEQLGNQLTTSSRELSDNQIALRDEQALAPLSLMTSVALLALLIGSLAAWLISRQITVPLRRPCAWPNASPKAT